MTTAPSFTVVLQRLAQHYLDTSRQANVAIHRGRGNRDYWYDRIDQDWGQIRHWQAWSASAPDADSSQAHICLNFSIAGLNVLRVRQSPPERITWLRQALVAARRTHSGAAERTILYEHGHT